METLFQRLCYRAILIPLLGLLASCSPDEGAKEKVSSPRHSQGYTLQHDPSLLQWVDPFIGTSANGHTFPGPSLPFGAVQLSPDNHTKGWDYCSGNRHEDDSLKGFSHTHLSGTGVGDLGDILLLPHNGQLPYAYKDNQDPDLGPRLFMDKASEQAKVGYYSIQLPNEGIQAELTASKRVGFHRYTFQKGDSMNVLLDLHSYIKSWHGENLHARLRLLNDSTITGYKLSRGWADEQHLFFAMRFNKPIQQHLFGEQFHGWLPGNSWRRSPKHPSLKALLYFGQATDQALKIKVAISAVDEAGALRNLEQEIPHWDFESVRAQAKQAWAPLLNRIRVKAPDSIKTIFYTALYHSLLAPQTYQDVDGRYRGIDKTIHQDTGFTNHTVFSLWDTYRALHPLLTILAEDKVPDLLSSLLQHYEQNFRQELPIWSLHGCETFTMIGYHAVPVLADAYLKGIEGWDTDLGFKAMLHSSTLPQHSGLPEYQKYGYIPADLAHESVSTTLEYAYDDWCIAQVAKKRGEDSLAQQYTKRSKSYKNLFNPQYQLMQGKLSDGSWKEPFNPFFAKYRSNFTEGNSWQYSWSVQHDLYGLMERMGGPEEMETMLDSLFALDVKEHNKGVKDITGLIGQYAHGNEPSHHVAYLYSYLGKAHKTQEKVRQIMRQMYKTGPKGLIGNEDCGQMSAWYIFSALGFYPVNPCGGIYVLGSPLIEQAELALPKGKRLHIKVENQGRGNPYIQSLRINGQAYQKAYISHQQIMQGGEWVFTLGAKPNPDFGQCKIPNRMD